MTETATKQWYIVHTSSGFEKKVAESLKQRVRAYGVQDAVGDVLIPTEDVVEMRGGKKVDGTGFPARGDAGGQRIGLRQPQGRERQLRASAEAGGMDPVDVPVSGQQDPGHARM